MRQSRIKGCATAALTLTGELDANSTPAMTDAIAAAIPGGRAQVVAGHRHMVNLTAPDIVTRALSDWLALNEAAP